MAEIKHFGVLGMRWGKHKVQEKARYESRKSEMARFQSDLKKAGPKAGIKEVTALAAKHDKNMAKIDSDFRKATGKGMPKGPVGERLAKALGAKQNSKGQWEMTPEAQMKATAIGIGLGTVAFFAEMKVRQFVTSGAAEKMLQKAEYAKWLRNG